MSVDHSRYEISESIQIDAPVNRVYAIAPDPEMVPIYAPEAVRIDILGPKAKTKLACAAI